MQSEFNIDKPITVASTIILSISGWMVFMAMPIMVGAFADLRGYGEAQVGYLASAELAGVLVSSIAASILLAGTNRRLLATGGLIVSLAINIVSLRVEDYQSFLMLRVIAGIGSGMCYAIAVANLAGTSESARNYSYMIFALVAVNTVELYYLPRLVDIFGLAGILYSFAAVNALTLTAVPFIAKNGKKERSTDPHPKNGNAVAAGSPLLRSPIFAGWMFLVAIILFYACIGSFWTYIERWGVKADLSSDFIRTTLAVSTVLSLAGCYVAFRVSKIVGQIRPLIATLFVLSLSIAVVSTVPTAIVYLAGLIVYQLLWNSIDIYQLGTLANLDGTGRLTALVSGAQGIGQMAGPAGAATVIGLGYGLQGAMYFSAIAALLATAVYFLSFLFLRYHKYVEPGVA